MKDEKMEMCSCGCHHGGMWGKHAYMFLGVVVFVYGLMSYFMVVQGWPAYTAWMVGGALLVIVGWVKKMIWMRKSM